MVSRDFQGTDDMHIRRLLRREPPVPRERRDGILQWVEADAMMNGTDLSQPQREAGDDAEVAATAAQCPQQLWVLAGLHNRAVRQHHFGGKKMIAGQPPFASEPAVPAAQSQPGQPGMGDDPGWTGQAVRRSGAIEVTEQAAAVRIGDAIPAL